MYLKKFLLFGEEGVAKVSESFSYQTRCITKLYENVFTKKFKTMDCKQLNFHCGDYSSYKSLGNVDGFCDVQVPYDIEWFLNLSDDRKKRETLELILRSIKYVLEIKKWDEKPFLEAYNRVIDLNYQNQYIWGKPKKSPDKTYTAEVFCVHGLYEFKINLIIRNNSGHKVVEQNVISAEPDELIYSRFLGELKWVDKNKVTLFENYSSGSVSISLPS
ncbi:hypothetical protein [Bacillus sp. V59.32b]|uniref:hypothetical protein n=1 Tax=Bacillus sp. V59.32b TaxID=1758642 RepID=UPI000E3D1D6E|nr:hypothetical protein [Bacillus sp. V59.32b]RFU62577.1 hypothetical protein D0463_13245 [Bacillus sp. V59.32b]